MTAFDIGRRYLDGGDPSTAARHLTEAAAAEPANRAVLTELARAHFHSAALGKAEKVARTLVELDPTDTFALTLLGRTLARRGRHAQALPHLRLAAAMTGSTEVAALLADVEARVR
ncbi:tetratricopeptide repeat protein [Actinokineospora inagensis]|uniref:tetratricopeptide repeat protein n=1 Tax=Actinokineospora inagensis TaxID=103730 RepID=UPI0004285C37|nr:tetratricopeptide repeat protein [Actinokineospora inagensis]